MKVKAKVVSFKIHGRIYGQMKKGAKITFRMMVSLRLSQFYKIRVFIP